MCDIVRYMRTRVAIAFLLSLLSGGPARAEEVVWLVPPVDAVIALRYQAPQVDWGPGHRGIDYRVDAGTVVRAAASGEVVWAGEVAGFPSVSVRHSGGLATTYSILSYVSVTEGQPVVAGQWIGRAGEAHPGE